MSKAHTVIQVQDLHKHYRLGTVGATHLNDELRAITARLRGRPDPRRLVDAEGKGVNTTKDFWALRGVDFEVKAGETVGIIGRNGAGKSTLLKLLSRITVPTKGTIRMKGRVSSLLEVGTGFHPELTGRENIYLNGSILGMRKAEIDRKLDEIIAFSGIEHHIDTPVKRYSSGMKVRLGFAVAAHLEPEILIVDEVLAVGDAEFQRKCLGKMKDVSVNEGRTVLFVSHNMIAVRNLCPRAIWLADGLVQKDGPTDTVANAYMKAFQTAVDHVSWEEAHAPGNELAWLKAVSVNPASGEALIHWEDDVEVAVDLVNKAVEDGDLYVTLRVSTGDDQIAFTTGVRENLPDVSLPLGVNRLICIIPGSLLNAGTFRVSVTVVRHSQVSFRAENAIEFEVQEGERGTGWFGKRRGVFRLPMRWEHSVEQLNPEHIRTPD